MLTKVKISEVKNNPNNPRLIKDDKFKKLVQSLKDLPEMAEVRPIVVNTDMVVLGGNMRLKAMKEAGWKEVPVEVVDWDEDKQKQFIIKDNVGFGEWDWDIITNEWDAKELKEWALDLPLFNSNEYFDLEENESVQITEPKGTDDGYSTFELVMLHENKLHLLEVLNKVKNELLFEKQEEALMEIIRKHEL